MSTNADNTVLSFLPVRGDGLKSKIKKYVAQDGMFLPVRGDGLKFPCKCRYASDRGFSP